jgi:hypothetical protein
LKTALERCCDERGLPPQDRYGFEDRVFREFRRCYHQFASRMPPVQWRTEWFAIMQHYGAPTRLLDFTYSIYVAAYFALERVSESDAAVWALDSQWAYRASLARLQSHDANRAKEISQTDLWTESEEAAVSSVIFAQPQIANLWPVNPFYLNERLRLQKGVCLVPGDISKSLMENLAALSESDNEQHVVKLRIQPSERLKGLRQLFHMNISRTTLFPGLDGFAQSLGVYHPTVEEPLKWQPEPTE